MLAPNPAQATGPMTLEQGLTRLKATMAESGTKADDQVVGTLNDDGTPIDEPQTETVEETATEDNAENVSDDASQVEEVEPDNRPVILPDGSEITVEEARKGYLRQADWTRKTTDVAREREALAAEKQVALRNVGDLYQQLASLQEKEPDWLALAQDPNTDPKQLQAAQAYWAHKKTVMTRAQQELQQSQRQALGAAKAKAFSVLNSGEFEPKWKDPQALKTGLTTVSDYLIEQGIPADALDGITEPAVIVIGEKARRWDELQKAKPKAALMVKGKPAPVKPGAKSTASPQSETLRLANERFAKNPTIANAVALEKAKALR